MRFSEIRNVVKATFTVDISILRTHRAVGHVQHERFGPSNVPERFKIVSKQKQSSNTQKGS